jgi:PAS domain-containing protein
MRARLAILYLLPVFGYLECGRNAGMGIAVLATLSWLISFQSSHGYSHDLYYYWEGAILLGTLLAFALLLGRLRQALEHADQRFVTVLEGLDAAVYVNDMATGKILYTNRRFREFLSAGSIGSAGEIEKSLTSHRRISSLQDRHCSARIRAVAGQFQDKASKRWFLVHARVINWIDGRA